MKDPVDAAWDSDPAVVKWRAFLDKYDPSAAKNDGYAAIAYVVSQIMVQVLQQCGDDVSSASIMKQAANLRDVESDMLLAGVKVTPRRPTIIRSSSCSWCAFPANATRRWDR